MTGQLGYLKDGGLDLWEVLRSLRGRHDLIFFFKIKKNYLFLSVLCLRSCTWALLVAVSRGHSLVAGLGLLIVVASLVTVFSGGTVVKNLPANAGDARDVGSIPVLGRSPGTGNSNSFQCSCLKNSRDRGAWWTTVCRVSKSWTRLSTTQPR